MIVYRFELDISKFITFAFDLRLILFNNHNFDVFADILLKMNTEILNFISNHSSESQETSSSRESKSSGYKCKFCSKCLSTKQSLREHSYIHTGQKPYICKEPGCNQTFRQSSQLSYHKRIHTELKKFISNEVNPDNSLLARELPSRSKFELPVLSMNQINDNLLPQASLKFHSVL